MDKKSIDPLTRDRLGERHQGREKMEDHSFNFRHYTPSAEERALRHEVRAFLATRPEIDGIGGPDRWMPEFSRALAARGWVGMTWPRKYGGGECTTMQRHLVAEELFSAGAPTRAHWVADRQSGPLLLAYGTEEQRERFLPRMARAELSFCIGMSEADSGSDLASIRTRAVQVDGGWEVEGAKLWTSNAHRADMMILFARTSRDESDRRGGVSQFLVDMKTPGITVRPIRNLLDEHDFNEVLFEGVFIPDDMVVGTIDNGWKQVTSELAYERSSPDRYLTPFNLVRRLSDRLDDGASEIQLRALGRLVSEIWTLQSMSLSVAGMLHQGEHPNAEAAIVKDLGTQLEQDIPEIIRQLVPLEDRMARPDDPFNALLDRIVCWAPAYTIRGGTREILRGIIARGLGLR